MKVHRAIWRSEVCCTWRARARARAARQVRGRGDGRHAARVYLGLKQRPVKRRDELVELLRVHVHVLELGVDRRPDGTGERAHPAKSAPTAGGEESSVPAVARYLLLLPRLDLGLCSFASFRRGREIRLLHQLRRFLFPTQQDLAGVDLGSLV